MQASGYRRYLLAVLIAILAFNFQDRLALGLVTQDIKADLSLNDAELGLLGGITFALFYSVMGVPIARWSDKGNRATIISTTTALWSLAVILSGFAVGFYQLMLIRVCVGIGEAGCVPPAHSLIADYFSRAERPRAVATYMQGMNISLIVGYFFAGWLNEFYGWRSMFVLLGLPGIILALLSWITIREPRNRRPIVKQDENYVTPSAPEPSLREVFSILWSNYTFRQLLYSFSVMYFFGYGILQWQPAYFVRSFGLSTGELGTWFSVVYGLCGILGTYLGGEWATRYAPHNEAMQLRTMAVVNMLCNVLIWSLIYIVRNYYVAFALMGLGTVGCAALYGPLFATIQTLVQPRMRSMSIAIIYLFANLIGMGLGPLAVGMLSDRFTPIFGNESLRYALLITCPGYVLVSWHLWRASKTVDRDLHSDSPEALRAIGGIPTATSVTLGRATRRSGL